MPQRSIAGFRPTGIAFGTRFYSSRDIEAIISAAGGLSQGNVKHIRVNKKATGFITVTVSRRKALAECLHSAAQRWHVNSQFQTKPTDKQLAESFAKIEAAANRLLKALHLPGQPHGDDPLSPMPYALRFEGLQAFAGLEAERLGGFPEWSGAGLLLEGVQGVYRLRDWGSEANKKNPTQPPTPRAERNVADAALNQLLASLTKIWVEIFENRIGTSVTAPRQARKSQAGGPMIRYLRTCLEPLLKEATPSPEGIRDRVRRLPRNKGKSRGKIT